MRTTIDKAGRIVIPKALREEIGLRSGEIEVSVAGAGLRIEPVTSDETLVWRRGRLVIPDTGGEPITDELVRALRDADRR